MKNSCLKVFIAVLASILSVNGEEYRYRIVATKQIYKHLPKDVSPLAFISHKLGEFIEADESIGSPLVDYHVRFQASKNAILIMCTDPHGRDITVSKLKEFRKFVLLSKALEKISKVENNEKVLRDLLQSRNLSKEEEDHLMESALREIKLNEIWSPFEILPYKEVKDASSDRPQREK
jgi:hypothetical protein